MHTALILLFGYLGKKIAVELHYCCKILFIWYPCCPDSFTTVFKLRTFFFHRLFVHIVDINILFGY